MTPQSFAKRIEDGKVNNLIYKLGGKEGLVSVWKHGQSIILTWEECPPGEQYDESTFTRDERYVFKDLSELAQFMVDHKLQAESFTP